MEIILWHVLVWILSFELPGAVKCALTWNAWHDLTAHLINKSSKGTFFFLPFCAHTHVCGSVYELSAWCKIAPWLQSKSMQSKQEMATIAETEGRWRGGGMGASRQMESWTVSQRRRGGIIFWQWEFKLVSVEFHEKKRTFSQARLDVFSTRYEYK